MTKILACSQRCRNRAFAVAAVALIVLAAGAKAVTNGPPEKLQDTGLYSDFATLQVDPRHLAFSPQYPLWTDGANKQRWIWLPPGTAIEASDPDAWDFPVGTRLWKQFSFDGRRVETRYMERQPDGRWTYAAYAWSADGREAPRVSDRGRRGAFALAGGRSHAIPSISDCKVCHQGGRAEVLGFSAVQLSPQRDPAALHADAWTSRVDLKTLVERGLLVGLPPSLLEASSWTDGTSPAERTALGYLHGNCGHCHNPQGPLRNVGLFLRQQAGSAVQSAITTTFNHPVRKPAPGLPADATMRIEPQHPDRSVLAQRMASRSPALQMPPLGTELVDDQALVLIRRWIAERAPQSPSSPSQ